MCVGILEHSLPPGTELQVERVMILGGEQRDWWCFDQNLGNKELKCEIFLLRFTAGQQSPIKAISPCHTPPGTSHGKGLCPPLLCCPRGFNQVEQCLIGYLSKLFKHVLSLPGLFGPWHMLNGAVGSVEWWKVFSLHWLGGAVGSRLQIH